MSLAPAQKRLLKQIEKTWIEHPNWTLGKLITSAASISRGQLRLHPLVVTDREIASGLRALIPDEDEVKK